MPVLNQEVAAEGEHAIVSSVLLARGDLNAQ
jgi:hypothetical protein